MTTTTPLAPRRRRIGRIGLTSSLVVVVGLGLAGCGGSDDDAATDTTTTTSTTLAQDQQNQNQQNQNQNGGNQNQNQNGGGGQSGPTPTIVSFTTPDDIDCHNGNFQNFSASWETTNATRVTISGGGEYPASGSTSLGFDCSSAHTYTLTAYASGGQTATRSVTLQPRNVQTETTDET
jgi:hypothetical protein